MGIGGPGGGINFLKNVVGGDKKKLELDLMVPESVHARMQNFELGGLGERSELPRWGLGILKFSQ